MNCDACSRPAEYTLTAAYDHDCTAVHPLVACYPMPIIRACREHLLPRLARDIGSPGATTQYVLTALSCAAESTPKEPR